MGQYLLSTAAITLSFPEATVTLALLRATEGIPPARPVSTPSISQHRRELLSPSHSSPWTSHYNQVPEVTAVPGSHLQSLSEWLGKARFHLLHVWGGREAIILRVCYGTCNLYLSFPNCQLTLSSLWSHTESMAPFPVPTPALGIW